MKGVLTPGVESRSETPNLPRQGLERPLPTVSLERLKQVSDLFGLGGSSTVLPRNLSHVSDPPPPVLYEWDLQMFYGGTLH